MRERIRRNPLRKQKILSRELNVSTGRMSQIIRDDLHMKAHRWSVGHRLDAGLKKSGMKEQRVFFSGMQLNGDQHILFPDEKILWRKNLTSSVTKSMPIHLLKLRSGLHGSSGGIMQHPRWWSVSFLHFCRKGVKNR